LTDAPFAGEPKPVTQTPQRVYDAQVPA
jgi:hypothetical protein